MMTENNNIICIKCSEWKIIHYNTVTMVTTDYTPQGQGTGEIIKNKTRGSLQLEHYQIISHSHDVIVLPYKGCHTWGAMETKYIP